MTFKPLGIKNYGSIPHLPNSRMGIGDHSCHEGQARIATVAPRDKHDYIYVQEKLDGSNVGVAKIDGVIYPLSRAGYLATTSPFEQHHHFAKWVYANQARFDSILRDGERLVGEWLMQAHGTRYKLWHEPFVAFDLMQGSERIPYDDFFIRVFGMFPLPYALPYAANNCAPVSVEEAMTLLGEYGKHGALDPVEGAVWRVERDKLIDRTSGKRKRVVDFLVKYVRPDKEDGKYLESVSGKAAVWNWRPVNNEAYCAKEPTP